MSKMYTKQQVQAYIVKWWALGLVVGAVGAIVIIN